MADLPTPAHRSPTHRSPTRRSPTRRSPTHRSPAHRLPSIAVAASLVLAPLIWLPSALASPAVIAGAQPTAKPQPSAKPTPPKPTPTPKPRPSSPSPGKTTPSVNTVSLKSPCKPDYQTTPLPASAIGRITPWPQYRLNPKTAWQLTKGKGVKVAVIDSGVDGRHPQLAGQVITTVDLTRVTGEDCYGHGTAVAAIIAGIPLDGIPFVGMAPEAKIISVKFQTGASDTSGPSAPMPDAIRAAVDAGASVINLSATSGDSPALREAVQYAQSKDVLIVAAAGNVGGGQQAVKEYPASYDGVLSVAAIKQDGSVADFSNNESRVDVASPGEGILSAAVGGGYINGLLGTSYSTPYVAGVAALVRSRRPNLHYDQVIKRIKNTADGNLGPGTGNGMVNPEQALTRESVDTPVNPSGAARAVDIAGPPPVDHRTRDTGLIFATCSIGAALLVAGGGIIIPAGRRRNWRPARAVVPREENQG